MALAIPRLLKDPFGRQSEKNDKKKKKKLKALYAEESYLDAYSRHTDLRVDENPEDAIGGHWDEMGELQFRFLTENGLKPTHSMLDIGCGTLRGGRHFIRYLDEGRYTGIDLSEKALAFGRDLLAEEKLTEKQPKLLLNDEQHLRFTAFAGQTFDVILAQSVFSHLPEDYIDECFAHLKTIMTADSLFFFTFYHDDEHRRRSLKNFGQPWSFYEELAKRYGYRVENKADEYPHPNGQQMVILTQA